MIKSMLSSSHADVLEKALMGSSLRNKVVANNIANVNTPNFKRSDVLFEDKLEMAMQNQKAYMSRTHKRHMLGKPLEGFPPAIVTDTTTTLRVDGNNVDIDAEMTGLAKNNIYYNATATMLSRYFTDMSSAIREGK